jgi:hypothetical protein
MFGIGLGLRSQSSDARTRSLAPWIGLGLALFLHSLWNSAAMAGGVMFMFFYGVVWMPVFAAFAVLVVLSLRREAEVTGDLLAGERADGTLHDGEYREVAALSSRLASEWRSLRQGGRRGWRKRRRFHHAASELALLRRHIACGVLTADDGERERATLGELRAAIEAVRRLQKA